MSEVNKSDQSLALVFEEKPNLIADLLHQLNKDLSTDQFNLEESSRDQILKKIEYILKAERANIASLLYRIDVPEEVALDIDNYQNMSWAILIREAQKVAFRNLHS